MFFTEIKWNNSTIRQSIFTKNVNYLIIIFSTDNMIFKNQFNKKAQNIFKEYLTLLILKSMRSLMKKMEISYQD